jgi:7-cyano-7-deazaguanine synthase
MDSAAIAYWRRPALAITVNYGQRPAAAEVRAATAIADALSIEHHTIQADLSVLGSGDMAGRPSLKLGNVPEWWPFRNQMLITLAAMKGIALDVKQLLIGTLATDCRHADGTAAFVETMNTVLRLQEGTMTLSAPAIGLTAVELIRVSGIPMEILAWAHSCHVSDFACGTCRGCQKHYETLQALGVAPY